MKVKICSQLKKSFLEDKEEGKYCIIPFLVKIEDNKEEIEKQLKTISEEVYVKNGFFQIYIRLTLDTILDVSISDIEGIYNVDSGLIKHPRYNLIPFYALIKYWEKYNC